MKSKADLAAVVALVALLGSGVGWIISVERRLASRVTVESYYADQKLSKQTLRGESQKLEAELNTDIRALRERMNDLHCPPCKP